MNFTWNDATASDRKMFEAINHLVNSNEEILNFMFCPERHRLIKRAGILKEDAWKLSGTDQLLIRTALDFWSGSGHVFLWELLEGWNNDDWRCFIGAICCLREIDYSSGR